MTVATGRWLVVLQGRTTEEPRLPKISPGNDDDDQDQDHDEDDGDDYDYNDYNDDADLNKVESVVGFLDGISIYNRAT